MPFTLSHPAAVLPLLRGVRGRGPLVASALVAGSMAPDVPYFASSLRPGAYRHGVLTHRWWAVPTVDVAIAGALVAAWSGVRVPLLALLPDRWAAAADAATAPSGRWPSCAEAAAFALSAAVGAGTHVGWDAFTHQGRAGVRLLPALNREVAGVPLYTVLQYGTSALALGGLGRYLARELPPSPGPAPRAVGGRSAGRRLLGLATALGAAHRVARSAQVRGPGQPRSLIADVCFGAGAGTAAGAVLLAAGRRLAGPPR